MTARAAASAPTAAAGAPVLRRRTGVEVELLAPRGSSRRHLADELARRCAGAVRPVFHTDSEASAAPGVPRFWHLTRGFEVLGPDGAVRCRLVDDTTIAADLDAAAAPRPGWYRVLSDDARLLRLVAAHADPAAGIDSVLEPVARLFGTRPARVGGVVRLDDAAGASIAMAAPLPGERERPCEVITPPLQRDHVRALEALLGPARELGFTVPAEAAVHLHLDAAPFRDVAAFANVVRLFSGWVPGLRLLLGTNPACRRLGALPDTLVELVERPWAGWEPLRAAAAGTGVSKFRDVNLTQVLGVRPGPPTLEVRVLPGAADGGEVVRRAALVEALLERCLTGEPLPPPPPGGAPGAAAALLELAGRAPGGARGGAPRRG
ncbi:amidoligase family protein [Kineococcus gypseus]|uniref:amidoligase family protein n=1 Tax=Kineococcus gypseus TaxID=1637102 RepID=UPI003D7D095B